MPFSQPGAGCGAEPGAPGQLKERQRSLRVGHEGSKGWKCCSQCPGLVLCSCCSHCGYNNKDAALFLSPQAVPAVWVAVCSPQGLPRARAPSPRMCQVTFAAQGIFPFLPKDGTRIHRNRTTRHPGYVHICAKFQQVPPGQCPSLTSITLWSILPWADPAWTQGDGQQQQRENGVITCSECAAGGDAFP